jgi:hypothetical protein
MSWLYQLTNCVRRSVVRRYGIGVPTRLPSRALGANRKWRGRLAPRYARPGCRYAEVATAMPVIHSGTGSYSNGATGRPPPAAPAATQVRISFAPAPARARGIHQPDEDFDIPGRHPLQHFGIPLRVFDHPQLVHEGRSVVVDDPDVGPIRQPTTLIHTPQGPLRRPAPAPQLDDEGGGWVPLTC